MPTKRSTSASSRKKDSTKVVEETTTTTRTTVAESSARASAAAKSSADKQEYEDIPSFIPYTSIFIPVIVALLDFYGYLGPITHFGNLFYFFVVLSAIDYTYGFTFSNPSSKIVFKLERHLSFRIVPWLFVPYHFAYIYWSLTVAFPEILAQTSAQISQQDQAKLLFPAVMYLPRFWGLLINTGTTQVYGILVAHELIHKLNFPEHWMGNMLLVLTNFPQYSNEHLLGHHRDVGLTTDATCAREDENYYAFILRNIPTYVINSFKLDWKKSTILFAITAFVNFALVPQKALAFHVGAGFIGQLLLLNADYMEHYALGGFRLPGEPVTPMVSWSDSTPATTANVLKVNVHANHHEKGGLRYQSLRAHAYSPQLPPYGYSILVLMIFVPPIWFSVMKPRVQKAKDVMKYLRESGEINRVFTREYLDEHPFCEDYKKIGWF